MKLGDEHRELIAQWREGLAAAHAEFQQWYVEHHADDPPRTLRVPAKEPLDVPDAVGTDWFDEHAPG